MGLLDKVKNIAFQPAEVDEPAPVTPLPSIHPSRVDAPRRTSSAFRVSAPVAAVAYVDPEMAKEIEAALAKCVGRGYKELVAQLSALSAAIPDENARIPAAIASLAVLQITPEAIKAAVQERIDALQRHQKEFRSGLEAETNATRQQFQTSFDSAQRRIADLEKELALRRHEEEDFDRELRGLDAKRNDVLAAFDATFTEYHQELTGLIARIR